MTDKEERLAAEIHAIYQPDDKTCSYTSKDIEVVRLILADKSNA